MKRIKTTLMASVLACATFNAQAEVSPLSYGIKAFAGSSAAMRYDEGVKIGGKDINRDFVNLAAGGNLYVEYAFTDYIGFGVQPGYMIQQAQLTADGGNASSSTSSPSIGMSSHGISVPLYLCIYPMGREEEGILKVMLGGAPYYSLNTTYKQGDKELTLDDNQKNESSSFDVALAAAVEYEFPFGLSIQGKYSFGIMNRFNIEQQGTEQTIFKNSATTGLKKLCIDHAAIGLGYNFASLFSE